MQKLPPNVRDTLRGLALDRIYWSNKAQTICENHAQLYRFATDWIGAEIPVSYVEFGVAHGGTMREISRLFSHSQSQFFGFDSFIGLPEDWLMHAKGAFSNGGHEPDVSDERVSFVKGWFQNTLPGFFDTKKLSLTKPILVHFDAICTPRRYFY